MKPFKFGIAAAIVLVLVSFAHAGPVGLTLLPGTAISASSGSTIGWGYHITNTTTNWVETLNLTADVFTNGIPAAIFDFPVIPPQGSVTQMFSSVATGACPTPDCGLFEFTWNSGVAAGTTNAGTFTITSELFGTNPLTDPTAVDLGPASDMTAPYSVSVSGGGAAVPEPATFFLLLFGLGLFLVHREAHRLLQH